MTPRRGEHDRFTDDEANDTDSESTSKVIFSIWLGVIYAIFLRFIFRLIRGLLSLSRRVIIPIPLFYLLPHPCSYQLAKGTISLQANPRGGRLMASSS
jgi:hypothetical protein